MADLIPAEIRKIAEDTQKIEDELFKKAVKTPEELAAEEKVAKEKAEAEKKAAEEAAAEPTEEEKAEAEKKAAEEKEAKEAEEAARAAEVEDPEKAEHKYNVLKGKYNKELPREREARKAAEEKLISSETENSILRRQLADLTNRLEVVERGGSNKKEPEESVKGSDMLAELDADPDIVFLKNEYPDFWKGVKKALTKTYDRAVENTASKITKVEKKVEVSEETTRKNAWNAFHKYLDDNVEGWREVNVSPDFKKWLVQEEKHLGIKEAIDEVDGKRVAKFFVDFAKSKEPPKKNKEDAPKEDKLPEDKTVAPPKGAKPNPPARKVSDKNEKITQESIAQFYERKRKGFYVGRETEMNVEEKKIELAVVEGRVI
jgi:hypothetical protein